jgi:hypothetical protein
MSDKSFNHIGILYLNSDSNANIGNLLNSQKVSVFSKKKSSAKVNNFIWIFYINS